MLDNVKGLERAACMAECGIRPYLFGMISSPIHVDVRQPISLLFFLILLSWRCLQTNLTALDAIGQPI